MGNVPIGHSRVNLSASTTSIDSGVSVNNKKQEKKNVGKRGGLSKADIGAPVANTFKHLNGVQVGPQGQMTQIGSNPEMADIKSLLKDMRIAKSDEDAEAMLSDPRQSEGIYQFIEQRGGLNEVKRKLRSESIRPHRAPKQPAPPPVNFTRDPPPINVTRNIGAPPPPPTRSTGTMGRQGRQGPPPPPTRRESIHQNRPRANQVPGKTPPPPPSMHRPPKSTLPPPPPSFVTATAVRKPIGPPPGVPPPPSNNMGAPPPPPPPPSAKPPGPPPPPQGHAGRGQGQTGTRSMPPPPPPSNMKPSGDAGRNALLNDIHKGMNLKHVDRSESISQQNTPRHSISEEGGMAEQLAAVLANIRPKMGSDDEDEGGAESDEWDSDSD